MFYICRNNSNMTYTYKVKEEDKLHEYSGKWHTVEEARHWYKEYGRYLASMFDRELVLVNTHDEFIDEKVDLLDDSVSVFNKIVNNNN